jgi:hypothetical protein
VGNFSTIGPSVIKIDRSINECRESPAQRSLVQSAANVGLPPFLSKCAWRGICYFRPKAHFAEYCTVRSLKGVIRARDYSDSKVCIRSIGTRRSMESQWFCRKVFFLKNIVLLGPSSPHRNTERDP